MFCSHCGAQLPEGTRFCTRCGKPASPPSPPPTAGVKPAAPPPPVYQQAPAYSPPAPAHKSKAPLVIILSLIGVLVLALIAIGAIFGIRWLRGRTGQDLLPPRITAQAPEETQEPAAAVAEPAPTVDRAAEEPVLAENTPEPMEAAFTPHDTFNYLRELTLAEYDSVILRWNQPIKVQILGDYSDEDFAALQRHINNLSRLENVPPISLVEDGGNFLVYYVPQAQMGTVLESYVQGYTNYYNYTWNDDDELVSFTAAFAVDALDQSERNYIMLETVSRGMGLFYASNTYEDSIFFAGWTYILSLSDMDFSVIDMLYNPVIQPGMDEAEVTSAILALIDGQ